MLKIPSVHSVSPRLYSYTGLYLLFVVWLGLFFGLIVGVIARFMAKYYFENPKPDIIFAICVFLTVVVFERYYGQNILKLKRLAELTNGKELKLNESHLEISVGLVSSYSKQNSFRAKDVWQAHSLNEFGYVVINWDEIIEIRKVENRRGSGPELFIVCKDFSISIFARALGELEESLQQTILYKAKNIPT
jgi:hypothetical protein